ncbi:MAG: branched-chain amino acid ABC transporter permease [Candidatus Bathyarchaeia archaeon]
MPSNIATKYFRKAYTNFATHIYDKPPRMLAFLILVIFAALPFSGINLLKLDILTATNVIAILAVSWDLLVGRTGQISLGHAMFYAAGAYGTALLFKYFSWPIWITIPLSLLCGVAIALIVGAPSLRMKGPYLALVTMAFPLAITGFLYYFRDIFGGETGIRYLPKFFPSLAFFDRLVANYYLSLALMTISSIIIYKIAASKTGIVFISILDDELGAKACGINVTKYKLMSFAISGLFGSLAGAVYAHLIEGSAAPSYLNFSYSIIPVIATILGGIGTIYGPLVGTYIYYLMNKYVFQEVLPLDQNIQLFLFIMVVVLFVIKWPRGIARTIVEKLEDLEEPREIEEIEKERAKKAEKV